ncbi:TetR/AcrR family transcriptional regulator [Amycolatopsis regifaucium]|uniref:TetR family transcriptional regulator n=1 Tax=Amycolatopsis regifaucium TaxID=546365 RepID=A0A154MTN6_9PSEU|nr:TetR family transcriptional regulator [Amycolatopsis regifaucium]KZB86859.1 TetR family transcriptional regulator [Amycolatopsis regifaucium]OKA09290.1 TetR family transcriptional regulator [Amycolatopsis regifaucium]
MGPDFQRARRPEQVAVRRTAILGAARELLAERPVSRISLRELADRVGLAKSNVLRYFDSREAIFLEVLDATWVAWLDELEGELGAPRAAKPGYEHEVRVATVIAKSLSRQHLLCELISTMAAVLERNISVETARKFKSRAAERTERLADVVRAQIPLDAEAAGHFAKAVFILVAGLWPYANPGEAVATVLAERGAPTGREMFVDGLTEGLANQLVGLVVRAGQRPGREQRSLAPFPGAPSRATLPKVSGTHLHKERS